MPPSWDPIASVSQRLESFVADRLVESAEAGPLAVAFSASAADTLRGGKRLRASFLCTGWRAVAEVDGGQPGLPASVVAAASALEVFQAAALVHDDIIDNSDTRRGRPATHRALEADHRRQGWSGDAAAHGRSAAILLGDLLVAWSDDLLEEGLTDAPAGRAAAARAHYAEMRRDVTLGQYLDIAEEAAFGLTPPDAHLDRALLVASFKSARYSVQQPLLIGGALAGASDAQLEALRGFGHPIGMAFQLRDDVLGVFGDAAVTGKPAGDDLREGKRTALIALAHQGLPASSRRMLDELLGDPDLTSEQVAVLQASIRDSGALARTESLIDDYAREADRALVGAPLAHGAVGALRDLAQAAVRRDA